MSDDGYVMLQPNEAAAERPFTAPEAIRQDAAYLGCMALELRCLLQQSGSLGDPCHYPIIYDLSNPNPQAPPAGVYYSGGRQYRIAFLKADALRQAGDLIVVGFCGRKRPGARRDQVELVDEQLISEFPHHPHFLSYSSLELADGDWRNLVLFNHWDGLAHWNQSPRHWQAVRDIAPCYYETIRLHNGVIAGGLCSGNELTLLRTKYYDFTGKRPWRALREYTP